MKRRKEKKNLEPQEFEDPFKLLNAKGQPAEYEISAIFSVCERVFLIFSTCFDDVEEGFKRYVLVFKEYLP